jgi:hypothetical protein
MAQTDGTCGKADPCKDGGRTPQRDRRSLAAAIMAISRRCAALPRRTGRTPDEIIGYDERGLPGGE